MDYSSIYSHHWLPILIKILIIIPIEIKLKQKQLNRNLLIIFLVISGGDGTLPLANSSFSQLWCEFSFDVRPPPPLFLITLVNFDGVFPSGRPGSSLIKGLKAAFRLARFSCLIRFRCCYIWSGCAAGSLIFASDNVAKIELKVALALKHNRGVIQKDGRLLLNDLRSLAQYDTHSSPGGLFGLLIWLHNASWSSSSTFGQRIMLSTSKSINQLVHPITVQHFSDWSSVDGKISKMLYGVGREGLFSF